MKNLTKRELLQWQLRANIISSTHYDDALNEILKEEEEAGQQVQDLIKNVSNYQEFVAQLGKLASDPKVTAFLKTGNMDGNETDDKFTATAKPIAVTELRPTQNEIDVKGSLFWPLTKPDAMTKCLSNAPITIKAPVVTYAGKWIIDGHHRWSQLYSMNKNGQINCIDLSGPKLNPIDVLKVVQLAIAADLGEVPVASVKGQNLLKMPQSTLKKYVKATIQDSCAKILIPKIQKGGSNDKPEEGGEVSENVSKSDAQIAANYIWKNVESMQGTSQPAPGAPKRDFMPQTDDATNAMSMIAKGDINYHPPYVKESTKMLINILEESVKKSLL